MSEFYGTIKNEIAKDKASFSDANRGSALSNSIAKVIMMANDIYRYGGINCVNIIKDTWATYSPILTLSLGYMFGKRDRVE